jgi:hypothetical protein
LRSEDADDDDAAAEANDDVGAFEAKIGGLGKEAGQSWENAKIFIFDAACGSVRSMGATTRMRARWGTCDCRCC